MRLCLCRANAHGAPGGQGQRSLDSESIDVGLCGSGKVKADHLQCFFVLFCFQILKGPMAQNNKQTNQKTSHIPLIYLIQCPRTVVTCSRPKSEVVYGSPCLYFSIKPLSEASTDIEKYVFSLHKLFALKHHI